MEVWDKVKGKVAAGTLTFLFGIGLVIGYTGLQTAPCPDTLPSGSICLVPADTPAVEANE